MTVRSSSRHSTRLRQQLQLLYVYPVDKARFLHAAEVNMPGAYETLEVSNKDLFDLLV